MVHHVEKIDGVIREIIAACFPKYTGKKVKISTDIPSRIESYWDGGSRNYYVFYSIDSKKVQAVGQNHPMFNADKPNKLERLPERFLLVEECIFCGKNHGITIYANPSDLAPMIEYKADELTDAERIVLSFTGHYKASYGGVPNIRYREAYRVHKIAPESWEGAKTDLIRKGMLDKRGAITMKGRNAIEGKEMLYRQ